MPTEKTPTWQWVAGALLSIVLLIASASLYETRGDIRRTSDVVGVNSGRITALEIANQIEFRAIRESLSEIKTNQKEAAEALERHEKAQVTIKKWQDYPQTR